MSDKINICILDFNEEDVEIINEKSFNIYNGSAGTKVEIGYSNSNSSKYCLLNYNYPSNLHEYEVLVINQLHDKIIPFEFEDHQRKNVSSNGETKLEVSYPTNVFDPRPFSFHFLNKQIEEFLNKQGLIILFADKFYEITYQPVHIRRGGYHRDLEKTKQSNYSFLNRIPLRTEKNGLKSNILVKSGEMKKLFEDFRELEYHQTFHINTVWDSEEGKNVQDPNYIPLMENSSNEIISYAYSYDNVVFFVFPDIKRKAEFTIRFLTEVAPQILPNLFSYSSTFDWLKSKNYWLPKYENLVIQKEIERKRHEKEIAKIEETIVQNRTKYGFLHNLITETDEKLVDAVVQILEWIGFENIIKVDEEKEKGNLEEDIQIQVGEKLLVIEVKGIGGTSKDSECNQISKIRLRRMKERKSTEVYGLYIVNHQRYKPPMQRKNPPFNEIQIEDAINDDRGLLTTWKLYKLYFEIENGIFTKAEIREKFFQFGLVDFRTDLEKIGKIDKSYKDGTIASLDINGIEINEGETVYSEKNGILAKHKILSIQKEKISLKKVDKGRIGIALDNKVSINSILYKRK